MKDLVAGLYGIGLDTYWAQFSGLEQRLEGYLQQVLLKLEGVSGVKVVNEGLVDTPEKARKAAGVFRRSEADIIFLYITTYALSSTVLPVVQENRVPVIILNIQPVPAIDYEKFNSIGDRGIMTGEWLAHCQACSVPEVAGVFNRAGIDYEIVTGYLDEPEVDAEMIGWLDAARVMKTIRNNRMGLLGHPYCGMLDVYTDVTALLAAFGGHAEYLEMDELRVLRNAVTDSDISGKIEEFNEKFIVSDECGKDEIERAAATSAALDAIVDKHELGSVAYYYEGQPGNEHENIVTSVIAGNTLLTGRNVPVAGEFEIKNAQAMKILDAFNAGGSFSEFYGMDFNDDVVLLGHDGPAHFRIAEGRVRLVPLPVYHGKPGKGLSIQMTVKHGPVTLLSVCEGRDGVFMLTAEGESVPGPVLEIGNTNSRYRFGISSREFIERWSKAGPSHHCAIGIGHIADKIEKLGKLLKMQVIRVC